MRLAVAFRAQTWRLAGCLFSTDATGERRGLFIFGFSRTAELFPRKRFSGRLSGLLCFFVFKCFFWRRRLCRFGIKDADFGGCHNNSLSKTRLRFEAPSTRPTLFRARVSSCT